MDVICKNCKKSLDEHKGYWLVNNEPLHLLCPLGSTYYESMDNLDYIEYKAQQKGLI